MIDYCRIKNLPPYTLSVVVDKVVAATAAGRDIINFGMGNPDLPTPQFIVDALVEAAQDGENHRYSESRGILPLRQAMADWYKRHYDVTVDPCEEVVVTMGAKEGIANLIKVMTGPGDTVVVPEPTYPIHTYAGVIAGTEMIGVPLRSPEEFLQEWQRVFAERGNEIRMAMLSFPSNPSAHMVDLEFLTEIVRLAKQYNVPIVHDLAYADLVFSGKRAPSILQVPGAKDIAVECYTMSKSYSMPGWRVGFCVGNPDMLAALRRLKSYVDYGMFQPIQLAAVTALNDGDEAVAEICAMYKKRRDLLCSGLAKVGWEFTPPEATMFVWAPIPEAFRAMGSVAFAGLLFEKANVAVSPGVGFGPSGEGYVRFASIQNEERIAQAVAAIGEVLQDSAASCAV